MGVLALAIVVWAIGGPVVRALACHGAERIALRCYAGLSIAAVGMLLLGSVSLSAASYVLWAGAAVVIVRTLLRWRNRPREVASISSDRLPRFAALNVGVAVAANLLAWLASQAPVTSWDAGTAHLAVPAEYVRAGHIGLDEGNVYSAYPQMLHSVFALILSIDGERGASTLAWALCVLACLAVYALAKRIAGDVAGAVSMALFATSPIYAAQAGTVAIDVPFTGFVAGSLLSLVAWSSSKSPLNLILAGAIAGSACGIRHTGYLVVAFFIVWLATEAGDRRLKSISLFAVAAAAASAPWWLRSWILVGNPVYPLFSSVFGDGGMPDVQVVAPLQHSSAHSTGLIDLVTFPWRILMHPDEFDGWQASSGGLTLALGVAGILVGGRLARRLGAFSLGGIVALYYVQRFARYLLPFLMPLHVLSGVAVARLEPLRRPIAALLAFSYVYGLLLAVGMMHFKLPAVIGLETRDAYLTRRVERYPAFDWANRRLPRDATVLSLDPRSYYLDRPAFTNLAALAQIAGEAPEERLVWMREHGIRYILVPEAYVSASPVFREWGIAPLIASWRAQPDRFVPVYEAAMPEVRGGDTERVTIYEVVWGDAGVHP